MEISHGDNLFAADRKQVRYLSMDEDCSPVAVYYKHIMSASRLGLLIDSNVRVLLFLFMNEGSGTGVEY